MSVIRQAVPDEMESISASPAHQEISALVQSGFIGTMIV
jgi:hypothetical protein